MDKSRAYSCLSKYEYILLFCMIFNWCPGPDLNRHDRNDRGILSPLCLPISPPGPKKGCNGRAGYHAKQQSKAPNCPPTNVICPARTKSFFCNITSKHGSGWYSAWLHQEVSFGRDWALFWRPRAPRWALVTSGAFLPRLLVTAAPPS